MQVFKTRWFARFARHEEITDKDLREAIKRAERGLIDADLGGGLIKQRVARPGKGRSGGYRVIVAYRIKERAVFLLGFAKSELDNIDANELQSLRRFAEKWLTANTMTLRKALDDSSLQDVEYGKEK